MKWFLTILFVLLPFTIAQGNNHPFLPAPEKPVISINDIERHWHLSYETEYQINPVTYLIETYYTNPDWNHPVQVACIVTTPPELQSMPVSFVYMDIGRNLYLYNMEDGKWVVDTADWPDEAIAKWRADFYKALGMMEC